MMFIKRVNLTVVILIVLAFVMLLMLACVPIPISLTFYSLTIQVEGQGAVIPSEGSYKFEEGAVVFITGKPAVGWEFSHWEGDVGDPNVAATTVIMDNDKSVKGVFLEGHDNGTTPREPGEQISYDVNGVNFSMGLAAATTFPVGIDDTGTATVHQNFWIAEFQVTYELWYTVREYAFNNGYAFANEGKEGSEGSFGEVPSDRKNEPVTNVNWYDSIVWCNALSEMLGLNPVYTINGEVIKNAIGLDHMQVVAENRKGFRLPTSIEWELAARYMGNNSSHGALEYPVGSGNYWTPGNYASGATGPAWFGGWDGEPQDIEATKAAAWYEANTNKTQDTGQKPSSGNGLGVFDMSGNVWEWCFTITQSGCVLRGGGFINDPYYLQVGSVGSGSPDHSWYAIGFRIVRTTL